MKHLLLAAVLALPLLGQSESGFIEDDGFIEIAGEIGQVSNIEYGFTARLTWNIIADVVLGKAYLGLTAYKCTYAPPKGETCVATSSISDGEVVNHIKIIIDKFNKEYADFDRRIDYVGGSGAGASDAPVGKRAATVANPKLIALSGFGDNNVSLLDLKTNVQSNTVILPNGMDQTFGVRSTLTGVSREVWTHHSSGTGIGFTGGKMVITNMETASIVANIPTNATAETNFSCIAIVFTNNGKTGYCASTEPTQDADGNSGGLRIFDAEARAAKASVRLPFVQIDSALMAPDGLTIFVIGKDKVSFGEKIVYYDVLTGTADLSVLLREPLTGAPTLFNNLFPITKPLIHPDGNRIFLLYSYQVRAGQVGDAYAVSVFDLSQRKLVSKFPLSFTGGGKALKMDLNQEGTRLTLLSDKGEVQFLDPLTGSLIGGYQAPATSVDIFTTPLIP